MESFGGNVVPCTRQRTDKDRSQGRHISGRASVKELDASNPQKVKREEEKEAGTVAYGVTIDTRRGGGGPFWALAVVLR